MTMKNKLSIAANQLKPKDLSRTAYTTLGFGNMFPIFAEECINKDKFNIKISNFSRVAPQYLPNLGSLNIKIHGFYVPFRLVWNHFENFKEGLPSWNSYGPNVFKNCPLIDDSGFFSLLLWDALDDENYNSLNNHDVDPLLTYNQDGIFDKHLGNSEQNYDFIVNFVLLTTSANPRVKLYFRFTNRGKQIFNMIQSLGYNFPLPSFASVSSSSFEDSIYNYQQGESEIDFKRDLYSYITRIGTMVTKDGVEEVKILKNVYSLLPLLCYFKIYLDYYIPSQLQPSSWLNQLFFNIHELDADSVNDTPLNPYNIGLYECLHDISYYYQNNYFTSSWLTPNAPVQGLNNIVSAGNPVINGVSSQESIYTNERNQALKNTDNGVSFNTPNSASALSTITADGLSFIQKFAHFIKRGNFAGSRSVERLLARFGVRVEDFQVGMCRYLGSDTINMQSTDVTVTGSTQEAGDYVGKSWFSSDKQNENRVFKCDCDLAGYVIFTASLEVPSTYLRGTRRRVLHTKPLDFYTPEMDGGQFQAISTLEVLNGIGMPWHNTITSYDKVFGFAPRYGEYKNALDTLSGDFIIPRLSSSISPFILPREVFDIDKLWRLYHAAEFTGSYAPQAGEALYDPSLRRGSTDLNPIQSLKGNDMIQFNRIFKDTTGFADPVISVFDIRCVVNSVSLPLSDSAELYGKGSSLEFESNGVHV